MRLAVVIPAYNEAKTIDSVVRRIPRRIPRVSGIETVVVDDNSTDQTYKLAKKAGAHVLSHAMNLGQGGAILTGVAFCKRLGADIVVTLDADGQHDPTEIARLLDGHRSTGADLVIGSRFLSDTIGNMPTLKQAGNRGFSLITYLLSGKMLTDTQSGFRLFGTQMIELLLTLDLAGYEFCSETIMIAHKHRLKIAEAPISTIYFDNRRGQDPINGINILLRLIARKLID